MKQRIRAPYFEVGVKNYVYGDEVVKMGKHLDMLSKKYDVDIIYIVPYTEIRSVAETTTNVIVFAPYMDPIFPGRGMGLVLPEAIKAAGAKGVLMNHSEKPMSLPAIRKVIERANDLELLSFACADTVAEARAIAELHPDIINPEPTELIGSGKVSSMSYVSETTRAIKEISPETLVEQAAGITTGKQVYDFLLAGSDGTGAGSGIFTAKDPYAVSEEMIQSVMLARKALQAKKEKE